jgi:DNA (cytosine-5)-methyltransferase 1
MATFREGKAVDVSASSRRSAKRDSQDASQETSQYTVAELFCGCGGLSHGFARSGRFRVVLGNDIKKAALRTFVHNHSRTQTPPERLEGDLRTISIHEIEEALGRQNVASGDLDCLIGGPPCQGFSQMRRSEERLADGLVRFKGYNKLEQDPRNDLVLRFLEIANALRPKIVLIENVPQMLRHGHNGVLGGLAANVRSLLQEMGYTLVVGVINSADYGVPQLRERSFFLASRIGDIDFPLPTHANPESTDLFSYGLPPWTTVRDALTDLPASPPAKETMGGGALSLYPRKQLSDYARLMRSGQRFPHNHLTRSYSQRIIDIVRHMTPGETWDSASARMQAHYEKLLARRMKEGSTKKIVLDRREAKAQLVKEGQINPVFYQSYYWSAYTRLAWDKPALTITANCNFLGSGRFTHPEEDRGITMREAARLQSFEDDFCFITSATRDETGAIGIGMDMIGEAVPPLVGEAFARRAAATLMAAHETKSENVDLPGRVLCSA